MNAEEDVKIVYENCNNQSWKTARDSIRSSYRTVGQSSGFGCAMSVEEKSHARSGRLPQMWRERGATSVLSYPSCSSAMSMTSSESSFASSSATQMDPLATKVEMIDLLNTNDGDSEVEILEDSDSTESGQTVFECKYDEHEEEDNMPLFSTKQEVSEEGENRNVETVVKEEGEIQSTSRSPAVSCATLFVKTNTTRKATELWREACRSSFSSSAEEEKLPVLPTFASTSSTISDYSSLAKDVTRMNIDVKSSLRRQPPTISPVHDEVSSSSDVFSKQSPCTRASDDLRELATASMWAETHDLGIDGDEFLETEDEAPDSDTNDADSEIIVLTTTESHHDNEKASTGPSCSSSARSNIDVTLKKTEKDTGSCKKAADSTMAGDKNVHRKRSSSSRSPHRSDSRRNKRFASDKNGEKPTARIGYMRTRTPIIPASQAPKARNLPRYSPVQRHYDFTRWLDAEGELVLHKIKDVATGLVSAPLGCTYDSALDTFIFTSQDSILFASAEGQILVELTLTGFDRPCAVAVLRPGQALGILDRSKLYLYEHHMRRLSVLATNLRARHRALAYTASGDFVTVRKVSGQPIVTVFDGANCDKVIASLPFPLADGVSEEQLRQPCFADCTGKQIFFTDLRANTLTCVIMQKDRLEKVYSRALQKVPTHADDDADQRFLYMSGVRCDDCGHLLVADAKTRCLKLLTVNGTFMTKARVADGNRFPFCSTFGVSPSGLLMACDRNNSRMILYRIGEETTPEDAIITDDVFDRMIGKNGVESDVRRAKEAAHRFS